MSDGPTLRLATNFTDARYAQLAGDNSFAGNVSAAMFSGSGSGLTDIPAASLMGIIPDGNIPSSVARLNGTNLGAFSVEAAGFVPSAISGKGYFVGVRGEGSLGVLGESNANWGVQGSSSGTSGGGVSGLSLKPHWPYDRCLWIGDKSERDRWNVPEPGRRQSPEWE